MPFSLMLAKLENLRPIGHWCKISCVTAKIKPIRMQMLK